MKLTKSKLKQIIKEEITKMLEAKFKVGAKVKHDSDDLGKGKVVACEPGKKGNICVRWEKDGETKTSMHHRWALKPDLKESGRGEPDFGGTYSFHDPGNIHMRTREDFYTGGNKEPEMLPINVPETDETITIVGMDGDSDTFTNEVSKSKIATMSSMKEVFAMLEDQLGIGIYGISKKSVSEIKSILKSNVAGQY